MKRIGLCFFFAIFIVAATAMLTSAQSAPEFKLGFKALADQIQDVVGTPLENEYFNLSNGNSEQHTTKGLMVWRKADNWTAFTNGYMTWINGPNGVQSRLNTERFDWEKDPVLLTSTPTPSLAPTSIPTHTPIPQPAATSTPTLPPPSPLIESGTCSDGLYGANNQEQIYCYGTLTNSNSNWTATNLQVTVAMVDAGSGQSVLGRNAQLTKSAIGPKDTAYWECYLPPFGYPVKTTWDSRWVPTR